MAVSYSALHISDNEPEEVEHKARSQHPSTTESHRHPFRWILPRLLTAVLPFLLGVLVGYISNPTNTSIFNAKHTAFTLPLKHTTRVFHPDPAFAIPPPGAGLQEPAWDALLPNGYGYGRYPPSSNNISVVTIFHQLHCLYTVRRAYYAASNCSRAPEKYHAGIELDRHVGHCFDYLRQGLMCAADSTVEPAEKSGDGFLGWGTERGCRDLKSLKGWASERRAFDGTGFSVEEE